MKQRERERVMLKKEKKVYYETFIVLKSIIDSKTFTCYTSDSCRLPVQYETDNQQDMLFT